MWRLICGLLLSCTVQVRANTLACLGDSNTSTYDRTRRLSWCDQFAVEHPDWVVHNYAVPGANMTTNVLGIPNAGAPDQFNQAMGAPDGLPTVIVMAFGTNDVTRDNFDVPTTIGLYQPYLDRAKAAGVTLLIATTPPMFPPNTVVLERIQLLNRALNRAYRRVIVDFYHGYTVDDMLDGVEHFTTAGEAKRLKRVVMVLKKLHLLPRVLPSTNG